MGGMIAQALPVPHPAQVSRLDPGRHPARHRHALPVPAAAAAAVVSSDRPRSFGALPPDQAAAERLHDRHPALPDFYQARGRHFGPGLAVPAVDRRERPRRTAVGHLRLPTLVADGTADQLDPVANDRLLADSPGSETDPLPRRRHAFLFQDLASSCAPCNDS